MNLENYQDKNVVLRNGTVGVVVETLKMKNLLKIQTPDGKTTLRYPQNVQLTDSEVIVKNGVEIVDDTRVKVSIDEKFDIMARLARMVVTRKQESLVITGEGGLGKTYTVNQQIEQAGLTPDLDFVVIKGYSTAKGLYRSLYEHNDKIIIFDDCDEVLKNEISKNILKSALDSYDQRIVSWVSQAIDDSLPQSFEFTGYIIFISNMSQEKVDQAVLSRSFSIDLSMSVEDKIARMRTILPKIRTSVPIEHKYECLDLIEKNKHRCNDLNMRTLIKVIKIKECYPEDWESIAEFMITSS